MSSSRQLCCCFSPGLSTTSQNARFKAPASSWITKMQCFHPPLRTISAIFSFYHCSNHNHIPLLQTNIPSSQRFSNNHFCRVSMSSEQEATTIQKTSELFACRRELLLCHKTDCTIGELCFYVRHGDQNARGRLVSNAVPSLLQAPYQQ